MRHLSSPYAFGVAAVIILLASGASSVAQGQSYKVIVNTANPVTRVSRALAAELFLKKVKSWEHGPAVAAVDQKRTAKTREDFSKGVLGKLVASVKSYWQKKIFTGRGVPPPEKSSDSQVTAFVRRHPGAIGYVSVKADVSGVKVIEITD
jgi:ABC-type phosphate transport system substrate-binding protein